MINVAFLEVGVEHSQNGLLLAYARAELFRLDALKECFIKNLELDESMKFQFFASEA